MKYKIRKIWGRTLVLLALLAALLLVTGCRIPFAVSVLHQAPCAPGIYVKQGEVSNSFFSRLKKIRSDDFIQLNPDQTFFTRQNVGGPLFAEVDGKYSVVGNQLVLSPDPELHLSQRTEFFNGDTLRDTDNQVWLLRTDCGEAQPAPAPPPPDREEVVNHIVDFKNTVLRKYDWNIDIVARGYGDDAYYRNSLKVKIGEWAGMILHALKQSVDIVTFANTTKEEFFSTSSITGDSAKLSGAAKTFNQKVKESDDNIKMTQSAVFLSGVFGNFDDYNQFELFTDPLDEYSQMADVNYHIHRGDAQQIADAMKPVITESQTVTINSRDGELVGQRPKVTETANNLNEGRQRIEDRFDSLIDNLPDPLPADFDSQGLISEIDQLKDSITMQSANVAKYPTMAGGTVPQTRSVTVGVLISYEDLQNQLKQDFADNSEVRVRQAINDGTDVGLSAVSTYTGGGTTKTIVDGVSLAKGTAGLVQEQVLVDEHKVRPIEAMNQNEVIMMLKLPEQESNLWSLSSGLCSYIDFLAHK